MPNAPLHTTTRPWRDRGPRCLGDRQPLPFGLRRFRLAARI